MKRDATFSVCGKYRYLLTRIWDESKPKAMCIGLNPSTANADKDDPTIESLIRLLTHHGYGSLYMMNLFALISPNPNDLRSCPDPVKENDLYLEVVKQEVKTVIFCWGAFPMAEYRAKKVTPMFPDAMCFGKNGAGSPKHPLYLKATTLLIPFNPDKSDAYTICEFCGHQLGFEHECRNKECDNFYLLTDEA